MCFGNNILDYSWFYLKKMGGAVAVGTSEAFHLGYSATLFDDPSEGAFGYRIGIRLPCLGTLADGGEVVHVPLELLLMCQMAFQTLVQTGHGTAHVAVRAGGETMGT